MDEILSDKPISQLPAGEKRSLRAAINGSPSRPESKSIRGNKDAECGDVGEATTQSEADGTLFAR